MVEYARPKDFVYDRVDLNGITLRDYQVTAVDYMLKNKRFCLFMGQGTGKTIMALTYFNTVAENEDGGTHIVLTPKAVLKQYIIEAEKYLDDRFVIITDAKKLETSMTDKHHLLITNYEQLINCRASRIDTLIADESQKLKSFTSDLNKAVEKLMPIIDNMYFFTGTPKDDLKDELFAQLRLMVPYIVPNKTLFNNRYFELDDFYKPEYELPTRIKELVEIIVKMTYGDDTETLLDLPPMKNYMIECRFKDKTLYKEMTKENFIEIDGEAIIANNSGAKRIKQRQLCNGFIMDEYRNVYRTENPKATKLLALIEYLPHGIIFTQFDEDIKIVSELLTSIGKTYNTVSGKTSKPGDIVEDFKAGKFEFLVIQTVSGNAGLDLSNTNHVIFYALPESAVIFNQARYRIRRIGQLKTCNYYYLVVKGTIEKSKMIPNLKIKREQHLEDVELYRRKV